MSDLEQFKSALQDLRNDDLNNGYFAMQRELAKDPTSTNLVKKLGAYKEEYERRGLEPRRPKVAAIAPRRNRHWMAS